MSCRSRAKSILPGSVYGAANVTELAPSSPTADLRAEVARVRWFHRIDLGDGIVTPGAEDTPAKLRRIGLPGSLGGRTVLDVGAWDGFFSFECERRGAARVVAVDPAAWRPSAENEWGSKRGFELARRALGSSVEDLDIDLLDLSPERVGTFDVVLFLGVLYHLPDPLPVLERVASVTGDLLIVETHADLLGRRRPAMAFYPGAEVDGDPSTWWGPNPALLGELLRGHGFRSVEVVQADRLPRRLARAAARRLRGSPYRASWGRCVVHARR
jgi:tRNA (mo5U34)-methyltransferase